MFGQISSIFSPLAGQLVFSYASQIARTSSPIVQQIFPAILGFPEPTWACLIEKNSQKRPFWSKFTPFSALLAAS